MIKYLREVLLLDYLTILYSSREINFLADHTLIDANKATRSDVNITLFLLVRVKI